MKIKLKLLAVLTMALLLVLEGVLIANVRLGRVESLPDAGNENSSTVSSEAVEKQTELPSVPGETVEKE